MLSRAVAGWRARVRALKIETLALAALVRDPRVPWPVRALATLVVAYALSPIDLIPDFVPLLGLVDDLLLLPLGVLLVIRLVPPDLLAEQRAAARHRVDQDEVLGRLGAGLVLLLWLVLLLLAASWIGRLAG